jgi:hypothetical protein
MIFLIVWTPVKTPKNVDAGAGLEFRRRLHHCS